MLGTHSLSSLPGPLWPGVVGFDWLLSMGYIELNSIHILNELQEIELFLTMKLRTYINI